MSSVQDILVAYMGKNSRNLKEQELALLSINLLFSKCLLLTLDGSIGKHVTIRLAIIEDEYFIHLFSYDQKINAHIQLNNIKDLYLGLSCNLVENIGRANDNRLLIKSHISVINTELETTDPYYYYLEFTNQDERDKMTTVLYTISAMEKDQTKKIQDLNQFYNI